MCHIYTGMKWEIEYTDEFELWWETLQEMEQASVDAGVTLLEDYGPSLRFPYSSGINGSKHGNMRELRIQHEGRPFRAAEKMNYPNLLVSWPVFGVAASYEYLDMHRLPRLEYGPTSGAIWDNLFFPRPLEYCTHLTRAGVPYCSWAVTKQAMTDGTTETFLLQTDYMTNT